MKNPQNNYAPPALDEEVRNRILMEQMPQVRYIARHIHDRLPQHVPIEDLVHAGVLGLMDALTKYDEAPPGAVQDLCQVPHPRRYSRQPPRTRLESARSAPQGPPDRSRLGPPQPRTGTSATEPEIAADLGLTLDAFQHLLGELEGLDLGSFHIEGGDKEHDDDLCEYLPGNPEESPYFLTMKSELHQYLVRAIEELSEKERQVLSLYYYEELTMKEAGAVLGVGESRVSQIHSLALLRLRTRLQAQLAGKQIPPHLADQAVRATLEDAWKKY